MARIAIPLGGTDHGRSGLGTYTRELLPRLRGKLVEQGHTVLVTGTRKDLEAYQDLLNGLEVVALPDVFSRPVFDAAWHLLALDAWAQASGVELLVLLAANRRMPLGRRVPSLAVVHDLAMLKVPGKYDVLRTLYVGHCLRLALTGARRVVAISEATRKDLQTYVGLDSERLSVVLNGVDRTRFRPRAPDDALVLTARASLGLTRPYLLYPSRLEHPGKNHLRLVEAFAASGLARTHDLVCVGPDWGARESLVLAASRLGISPAVHFPGRVSNETLQGLMAGAEAVLALGLWEGFGLPAMEALSAGRPVLVSDSGALPEVVGPLGVRCDPLSCDAIQAGLLRVVRDEAVRQACAQLGPLRAETFAWERTAERLYAACVSVLREREGTV